MKRLLLIIVFILAALAVMVIVSRSSLFDAEGRRARMLRNLEHSGLVVRRSCASMETFVQASRWSAMSQSDQESAARALGAYCQEQGGTGQMTVLDTESRQKLAHWNGSALQR
jgi:hypothetical protein